MEIFVVMEFKNKITGKYYREQLIIFVIFNDYH